MLIIDSAGKIVATASTSDNQERDLRIMVKKSTKVADVQGLATIPHKLVYNGSKMSFIVDRDIDIVNDLTNYLIEKGCKYTGAHYIEENGVKKLRLDTDMETLSIN